MGLLFFKEQKEAAKVAEQIFASEFGKMPTPYSMTGQGQSEAPFEGMVQTIVLLDIAVSLNEPGFFRWCSAWSYVLLCKRMPMLGEEAVRHFMIAFCSAVKKHLEWITDEEKKARASIMLDDAIDELYKTNCDEFKKDYISAQPYATIQKKYLEFLLGKDMDGAMQCIVSAMDTISLNDIYTQIIQNVMYEVGELWHQNKISVAQEHYCTAATQTIMAMLYPQLMSKAKNGKKVVVACIGSELHELGARMVSDLFTNENWDSIFLGAAVPLEALLQTLREEAPDICALSVSMQQGIPECVEMVRAVKKEFPEIIIAVGGHAFIGLENSEKFVGADIFSVNAADLIKRAKTIS